MIGKQFITAGRAVFTLEIPADFQQQHGTPPHYTFRITRKENDRGGDIWFVSMLVSPDEYAYVGLFDPNSGVVRLTRKSKYSDSTWPVRLLRRTLNRIWAGDDEAIVAAGFEVHHEGRCGRCGRPLTTPESVRSGIGPVCAAKE